MKQIKLHPIIQSYFEQLESLIHRITLPDEIESIHDFRVIYKKLRTIIRLGSNEKKQISIPKKEIKNVARLWDQAKKTTDGFEVYAQQICQLLGKNSSVNNIFTKIADKGILS